jgi:hypothetical protein
MVSNTRQPLRSAIPFAFLAAWLLPASLSAHRQLHASPNWVLGQRYATISATKWSMLARLTPQWSGQFGSLLDVPLDPSGDDFQAFSTLGNCPYFFISSIISMLFRSVASYGVAGLRRSPRPLMAMSGYVSVGLREEHITVRPTLKAALGLHNADSLTRSFGTSNSRCI